MRQGTAGARWGNRGSPTQLGSGAGTHGGTRDARVPPSDPQSILARHPRKNAGFARDRKGGALRELSQKPGSAAGSCRSEVRPWPGPEPCALVLAAGALCLPPSRQAAPSCSAHPKGEELDPARLLLPAAGVSSSVSRRPQAPPYSPGPAPSLPGPAPPLFPRRPVSPPPPEASPGAAPRQAPPRPSSAPGWNAFPLAGKSAEGSTFKSPISGLGGKGKGWTLGAFTCWGGLGSTLGTLSLMFFLVGLHTFFFFSTCYPAFHHDWNRINSWEPRRGGEGGVNQCFITCKMGRRQPAPWTFIIHC